MVKDIDEADFQQQVVERSKEIPVVVDFWAEWCGPCRTLGPAIERAVDNRAGEVELAKVDVDSNQRLAAAFHVQGIPAVKAFRDGEVVDEFTGALPPAQIEAFLDRIVPSEADEAAKVAIQSGDEQALRDLLATDPDNAEAAAALARLLLTNGQASEAKAVTAALAETDMVVGGLNARAALAGSENPPTEAFTAWDLGEHDVSFNLLQQEVETANSERRDLLRRVMVGCFTELGPTSEVAATHRRRLARVLN